MIQKISIAISMLLIAGLAYLYFAGQKVQVIQTDITIAAPPEVVWSVLQDIESWQEWSPIIVESSGDASVGSQLQITMIGQQEGEAGPRYQPKILAVEPAKLLHWRALLMGGVMFTNDKLIELQPVEGGTRLVHKEMFHGLMAPIVCSQMEVGVPPMLNAMNEALKEKVESI